MRTGDQVRVYPHGKPELAATGRVTLVSDNQLSIAVAFTDKPPFAIIGGAMAIHEGHLMLCAYREKLHDEPWGPWIELFGGSHFEIEEPSHE